MLLLAGTTLDRIGKVSNDGSAEVQITLSDEAVGYLNALPSDVVNFLVTQWQSFDPTQTYNPNPTATNDTGISTTGSIQTQLNALEQSWVNTINDPQATESAKVDAYGTEQAVEMLLDNVASTSGAGVLDMKLDDETANSAFMQDIVDPTQTDYGEFGFNLVQSGQQFVSEDEYTAEGSTLQGVSKAIWDITQDRSDSVIAKGYAGPTETNAGTQATSESDTNTSSSTQISSILSTSDSATDWIDDAIAKMLEASDQLPNSNAQPTSNAHPINNAQSTSTAQSNATPKVDVTI